MKKRFTEGARVLAVLSFAAAAACGGKIGVAIPDPYSENDSGGESGATSSSANASSSPATASSGVASSVSSTPPATDALCSPIASDPSCSVSFQKDILDKMLGAEGTLHCAKAGCHDATGGVTPFIELAQPSLTYVNLYYAPTNIPYVNPCSTDPTKSAILGSLSFPATQGSHMPQDDTAGALPDKADLDTITTWVECGAPLN